MTTYSQIAYGLEKRKKEKKPESFEELAAIAKKDKYKAKTRGVKVRNERHYTFTERCLEIIEIIKQKRKCKNTSVAREAIIFLNSQVKTLGENHVKLIVMLEKIIMLIENTTLKESEKEELLNDVSYIRFLVKKHGIENIKNYFFEKLILEISMSNLKDSIKDKILENIDKAKAAIKSNKDKQNLFKM